MDMSIPMPPDSGADPASEQAYIGADPGIEVGATTHGRVFEAGLGRARSIGEITEGLLQSYQLDRDQPLVRCERVGPVVDVTFYDRNTPGFVYEFSMANAMDALKWIRHLALKTWVTKRHLEWFASLAFAEFEKR